MKNKVLLLLLTLTAAVSAGCFSSSKTDITILKKTYLSFNYGDVKDNYRFLEGSTPTIGTSNLLVFPVYFNDSSSFVPSSKKENVRNDIITAFNGTKEETGWNSVNTYYLTESDNKCNLNFVVTDWIDVDQSYEYFASGGKNYLTSESRVIDLANSLVDSYFEKDHNRSDFDSDQDGYLDGIILIYAAPNYQNFVGDETFKDTNYGNLWAYTNWDYTKSKNVTFPAMNNHLWASYDFMYDATKATVRVANQYHGGDCSHLNIDTHIYIHEMGHMLGLQDYYDYSNKYKPAGGFSMQDCNVGGHDPFSVMSFGWTNPYIPTDSCTLEINKFQDSHEVILLTNSWNEDNSPFDEYLLLEFYSATGLNESDSKYNYKTTYPKGIKKEGIRLWHVDARLLYSNGNFSDPSKVTTNPLLSGYKVVEMMSNTYGSNSMTTPLGVNFANYNILQLIRNDEFETYLPTNSFDNLSLFTENSIFSMSRFSRQFVGGKKLNNGSSLGWTFKVISIGETAKISFTKLA